MVYKEEQGTINELYVLYDESDKVKSTKIRRMRCNVSLPKQFISLESCFGVVSAFNKERVNRWFLILNVSVGNIMLYHKQHHL
jgi:hypothetical protein